MRVESNNFYKGGLDEWDMISDKRIREYCRICDNYRGTEPCVMCNDDNYVQQGFVVRNWCAWARINGVGVQIDSDSVRVEGTMFPRGSDELEEALKASEEFKG